MNKRHISLFLSALFWCTTLLGGCEKTPAEQTEPVVTTTTAAAPAAVTTTATTTTVTTTTTTSVVLEQRITLTESQKTQMRTLLERQEWCESAIKGIPEYIFTLDGKEYWLSVTDGWCNNHDDYTYARFSSEDVYALRDIFQNS